MYRDCCAKVRQRRQIRARKRAAEKVKKLLMSFGVFCIGAFALCMLVGVISSFISLPDPESDNQVIAGEKNNYGMPYVADSSFEITSKKEDKVSVEIKKHEIVYVEKVETEPIEVEEFTEKNVQMKLLPRASGAHDVYIYHLSHEDMVYIAKVVWAEARGESFEGKVAVAAVILNRYFYGIKEPFNRDSIYSVITQSGAFASIKNVTMSDLENVPDCMKAVEAACKGWDPTREMFTENGAMYFYNPNGVSGYQKEIREGIKFLKIGAHNFHVDFNTNVED